MSTRKTESMRRQQGAILAISLAILLLMTVIGLSAMQVTSLEAKMAGNMRDHELAFQAAEAALRDAERVIAGLGTLDGFGPTGSRLDAATPGHDYRDPATWAAPNSEPYSGADLQQVGSRPRYFIKHVGSFPALHRNRNAETTASRVTVSVFRVTARGTGGSSKARSFLRTHVAALNIDGLGPPDGEHHDDMPLPAARTGRLSWQELE